MSLEQLEKVREMKSRRPFVAFRILATGGDRYLVENRFQFAIGQTEMLYVFPGSAGYVRLKAEQLAGVEVVEQKPAA